MNLRTMDKLIESKSVFTKRDAAEMLYPGVKYDGALPQNWVNDARDNWEFDVRGCVIWAYPEEYSAFGTPFPLTTEAAKFLKRQGFRGWGKWVEEDLQDAMREAIDANPERHPASDKEV